MYFVFWIPDNKKATNGASSEKDQFRILIVCFSCLFMSSFRYLVANRIDGTNWSEIPRKFMMWISLFTGLSTTFMEEICLLLLVRDFRKDVKKQLRIIFCFFTKKSSSTNNNVNAITIVSSTNNTRARINNRTQKN